MVVTQPCIGCKDKACLPVCPAECFHEDELMVYIDPDECIDCGACVPECPTEAIFYEMTCQTHGRTSLNSMRPCLRNVLRHTIDL